MVSRVPSEMSRGELEAEIERLRGQKRAADRTSETTGTDITFDSESRLEELTDELERR